eukprot:scaffold206199_cov16-Prasinocladus_malaysianus.AAC.1
MAAECVSHVVSSSLISPHPNTVPHLYFSLNFDRNIVGLRSRFWPPVSGGPAQASQGHCTATYQSWGATGVAPRRYGPHSAPLL